MTAVMKKPNIKLSTVNVEERKNLAIRAGDTVRVSVKVEEKGKTRIQVFEGIVLARKHGTQPGATFTVRRVSGGYGIERIFPLYSPAIDKIEIVRRVKTRRAKLYHIREKAAREIKRQMRKMQMVSIATESDIASKDRLAKEAEAKRAEEEAQKIAEVQAQADTPEVETPAEE